MNSKLMPVAIVSATLLLACNKGENKPAADPAQGTPAPAAAAPAGFDFKQPCAVFNEEIAALISSAPFGNPMENASDYVSMCQRISKNPGATDHGAFARFEPMRKESFDGRNCQPPNAENGMTGYTLEVLTGVGEAACVYQSKTPTFATMQVYAAGHSIQLGNATKEKLLAAFAQMEPKLK